MSAPQDAASPEALPVVWRRREPLGYAAGLVSFASVAAPLLAGFSLTAIVELVGRSNGGTRGDIAIAAFALAAGLLIYAIQVGLAVGQLAIAPDQRAAQVPEARGYPEWMQRLREDQWRDAALAERLFIRTRLAYNLGIFAFLGGLVAALLPGPGDWNAIRIAAVAIAGTAGVIELLLVSPLRPVRHWLLPMFDSAPEGETEVSGSKPDEIDSATARWLIYGDRSDTTDQGLAHPDGGREILTALTTLTAQLASLTGQLARLEVTIDDAARQLAGDLDEASDQST